MKLLAIDLDDTLFEEQMYVMSGFKAISNYTASCNGISSDEIFNQLVYQFYKYGRTGVFNRMLSHFEFNGPRISKMVELYREHNPSIYLYDDTREWLAKLREKFKTAIVTDGFVNVQKKKILSLKLENSVDKIIYCMDYNSPKPSVIPYKELATALNMDICDMIIIGDDPYMDIQAANELQIPSYRVTTGKYKEVKYSKPTDVFSSFCDVAKYLEHNYD